MSLDSRQSLLALQLKRKCDFHWLNHITSKDPTQKSSFRDYLGQTIEALVGIAIDAQVEESQFCNYVDNSISDLNEISYTTCAGETQTQEEADYMMAQLTNLVKRPLQEMRMKFMGQAGSNTSAGVRSQSPTPRSVDGSASVPSLANSEARKLYNQQVLAMDKIKLVRAIYKLKKDKKQFYSAM